MIVEKWWNNNYMRCLTLSREIGGIIPSNISFELKEGKEMSLVHKALSWTEWVRLMAGDLEN